MRFFLRSMLVVLLSSDTKGEGSTTVGGPPASEVPGDSAVVASVNGRAITVKEVRDACRLRSRGPEVVDDLVRTRLLVDSVEALDQTVSAEDVAAGNWDALADRLAPPVSISEAAIQSFYSRYPWLWNGEEQRVFERRQRCADEVESTFFTLRGDQELALHPELNRLAQGDETMVERKDECSYTVKCLSIRVAPRLTFDEARPVITTTLSDLNRRYMRQERMGRLQATAKTSVVLRLGCALLQNSEASKGGL